MIDGNTACTQTLLEVAYLGGYITTTCVILCVCAIFALAIYIMRKPCPSNR